MKFKIASLFLVVALLLGATVAQAANWQYVTKHISKDGLVTSYYIDPSSVVKGDLNGKPAVSVMVNIRNTGKPGKGIFDHSFATQQFVIGTADFRTISYTDYDASNHVSSESTTPSQMKTWSHKSCMEKIYETVLKYVR